MFIRFSILVLSIVASISTNAQTLQWATQFASSGESDGNAIAVDNDGNVYTSGSFEDSIDFDPGPGELWRVSNGGEDIYVTKQDAAGNLLWAHSFGTTDETVEIGRSVAVDGSGNVYVGGYFRDGTADFDPGSGTLDLHANDEDAFLVKLDAAGNLLWAKDIGGSGYERIHDIVLDGSGGAYVFGNFSGEISVDIDGNVVEISSGGGSDIFLGKIDASGNMEWIKDFGGNDYDIGSTIARDNNGNLLLHGYFRETADFDPGPGVFTLTSDTLDDFYVCKFTALGDFVWAKQFKSDATEHEWALGVATDAAGNVYTTGFFHSTCDFDPGTGVQNQTSNGDHDIYVSKLNNNGDFEWVRTFGSDEFDVSYGIASDPLGNVYVTGHFNETIDFDPGANTVNLTSFGNRDIFILHLDASGNYVNVLQLGGTGWDFSRNIAVDADGSIYATGHFHNNADFDPGPDSLILQTNSIGENAFVVKLGFDEPNSIQTKYSPTRISLYPNPTNGKLVCELDKEYASVNVAVKNILGQQVFKQTFNATQQIQLNLNNPSGIYFIEVSTAEKKFDAVKIVFE